MSTSDETARADEPDDAPARRGVQLVGWAFAVCSVVMVPWTVHLVFVLPSRAVAAHVRLAWTGFDVGLLVMLAWTAWSALRGSRWLPHAAVATATFLVIDAWFDVVTSNSREAVLVALVLACFVELPLATVCVWLAVTGQSLSEHRLVRRFAEPRPRPPALRR